MAGDVTTMQKRTEARNQGQTTTRPKHKYIMGYSLEDVLNPLDFRVIASPL